MTRTGAVWMIRIWHSSAFSHSWFRFELPVHLDLCCWFNKQTQYIVHHASCIIKLLTYFQTSSFYSSLPLSFPSFPLSSPPLNPRTAFCFIPKLNPIKDQIMSEVSLAALQTALCYRTFPEVVSEIAAHTLSLKEATLRFFPGAPYEKPVSEQSLRFLPQLLSFCEGPSELRLRGFQRHWGTMNGQFLPAAICGKKLSYGWKTVKLHTNCILRCTHCLPAPSTELPL